MRGTNIRQDDTAGRTRCERRRHSWPVVPGMFPAALLWLTLLASPAVAQRTMGSPTPADVSRARPTTPAPERVTLSRVVPNRLDAGGSYTLTVAGSGFVTGMTASFGPPGINVLGPVAVQSAHSAQLRVQVTPGATPGFRTLEIAVPTTAAGTGIMAMPGEPQRVRLLRAVEVVGAAADPVGPSPAGMAAPFGAPDPGQGAQSAPSARGQPDGLAVRMPPGMTARVTRIAPATGEPGGSYTLELRGVALAQGMRFGFGPDIEIIGAPQRRGTSQVRLDVRIRPQAQPGPRPLQLAPDARAPFVDQSVAFTITAKKAAPAVTAMPVPKIAPPDLGLVVKNHITLTAPDWKTQTASTLPPKDPVTGKPLGPPQPVWTIDVPALREDQLFTWQELNPGVAEWFEVRFYRKDKLVTTRRIDPVSLKIGKVQGQLLPTWLRVDAALIAQLVPPQGPSPEVVKANPVAGAQPVGPVQAGKIGQSAPAPEQQAAAQADLYWEVAGWRQYSPSGVAQSAADTPDDVPAIEPILVAAAGKPPAVSGQMPAKAVMTEPSGSGIPVEVEISDRWPLATPFRPTGLACGKDVKGKFNLLNVDKKGFGSHQTWDLLRLTGEFSLTKSPYLSKPKVSKPTFMGKVVATTWSFDNLFVDWGDGTQQPFATTSVGDAGDYKSGTQLSLGSDGWTHQYQEPGQYVVRVYQLANQAVQQGNTEVLSASMGEQQGLYFQTLAFDASLPEADAQLAGGKAAADSAYMLYCQHVSIAPRTDPDASGPLKLVRIEVQGFPWGDPQHSPADPLAQANKQLAPKDGSTVPAVAAGSGKAVGGAPQGVAAATALFGTGTGNGPAFSACDITLTAGAALGYVGQGSARLRWRLDGSVFHEEVYHDIGPSPPRPDKTLAQDPAKWGQAPQGVRSNLLSGPIPLDKPAQHQVSVEAEVIYSTKSPGLAMALAQALGAGGKAPDAAAAQAILLGSQGGPKIGVLTPYTQSSAGLPAVSYVQESLVQVAGIVEPLTVAANTAGLPPMAPVEGALGKVAGALAPKKAPPEFVQSKPAAYQVVGHDAELPCTFEFKVSDGSFLVGGLQSGGKANVTHQGDVFSGSGVLQLPVPGQPGKHLPLPLSFQDWKVAADGFTVTQGKLQAGPLPGGELTAAGVAYSIAKLAGTAPVSVEATLAGRLAQGNILAVSAKAPPSLPAATAVLSPQGDWYATGLSLGELLLYDSGFTLAPKAVTLDLSTTQGEAPDAACAVAGAGWSGVHLGAGATLTAYDFDLPGSSTAAVDGFGIDSKGLCGTAQMGPFAAKQLRGEFRWDGIDVDAGNGQFSAVYQNLRVKVPWLDVELKGTQDPLLKAGEGTGQQTLSLNLVGGPAKRQHGPITLTAQNLQLVKPEGMVTAVRSDTRFDFAGEDKVFAKEVWVKDLHFGLDGRAYFAPGVTQAKVGLTGQSGAIGPATLTLDDVTVTAPAAGTDRLVFDFNGKVTISKALEPAKMTVRYAIVEPSENLYASAGPLAGSAEPFSVTFPKAEGTVKGKIKATYTGAPGPSAAVPAPFSWIPAAHADAGQLRFKGTVDMNMFALPVTADFALGYAGSDDFWAIKAVYDGFGPSGAPLVPPFLNMFAVGGGLGYNVSLESLKGLGLESLGYSSSGGVPVFNAASVVGTPDGFTLGVRGDLSIKVAGSDPGTRLDFAAFLLSSSSNWKAGSPPFEGFIKYQGGSFHGELWGGMEFFGGAAGVKAPKGAAQLHFGGGDWYAYLGRDSGPRVEGHALFIKGNAYLMLDSSALKLGGGADMFESLGDCGDVCAYVEGKAEAGLALGTSPLKLAGTSTVSVEAGGCYEDECAGVGGAVDAYGELPGPVMRYGFAIDLPCPVPDVGITLKILPSPGVSPSLDWCDMNPLW